jgi:transcriptional regulator with XRE-family HTH domain
MLTGTNKTFGARIRELREARGFTTRELAFRSGLSHAMVAKTETGERNPGITTAVKLTIGLGMSEEKRRKIIQEKFGQGGTNIADRLVLKLLLPNNTQIKEPTGVADPKRTTDTLESLEEAETYHKWANAFFNDSRQILSRKLRSCTDIEEVLKKLEDDPKKLIFYSEDGEVLPRAYLALKNSKIKDAIHLKDSLGKDITRLNKISHDLEKISKRIQQLKGPKQVDMRVLNAMSQVKILDQIIPKGVETMLTEKEINNNGDLNSHIG